ncbi:NUDIX hydrolase [Longimicrobium sp.]|jgi:ADP-ribose pyrophosphatase|uniref:NUDIX hydrolase n=1 Tax=Longimicrobium sp. TaxID=2029185 RepID=UPI002ED89F7C
MSDPEIRIIQERLVYESRYGRLYDDFVEFLPQGATGTYLRWEWEAPYSIAVLPILLTGEIILVESFRHSARGTVLEVPKGFGRTGTAPVQIAHEELAEEVGLQSTEIRSAGMIYTDPAFAYAPFHLFVAQGCSGTQARPEESEVIVRSMKYALSEVPGLLAAGTVNDAVTVLLLQQYLLGGLNHEEADS